MAEYETFPAPITPGTSEAFLNEHFAGRYFDREGHPISWSRFRALASDARYKVLRRSEVGDLSVVTAWLGGDQGFGFANERPLIFGTIVRRGDAYLSESEIFAASEEQALVDHDFVVSTLRTETALLEDGGIVALVEESRKHPERQKLRRIDKRRTANE